MRIKKENSIKVATFFSEFLLFKISRIKIIKMNLIQKKDIDIRLKHAKALPYLIYQKFKEIILDINYNIQKTKCYRRNKVYSRWN